MLTNGMDEACVAEGAHAPVHARLQFLGHGVVRSPDSAQHHLVAKLGPVSRRDQCLGELRRTPVEKSWIKLEYTTEIMSGETPEIARERAHSFVDDGVLKSIQQTVETVRKVNR
jgi:hypothetical protein